MILLIRNRKIFFYFRITFLSWVLVWLGWLIGGQLSVIHLINILELIFTLSNNFTTFLIEPVVFLIGIFTLLYSVPIVLGVIHQLGGVILFLSSLWLLHFQKGKYSSN